MLIAGIDCKLYRNTGTSGTPTWTLIDNCSDVVTPLGTVEEETTERASAPWQTFDPVLLTAEISFKMLWKPANANCVAFRTAYFARSMVEIAIADGPIATAGTNYIRAEMKVFSREQDQSNTVHMAHNITLKPCHPTDLPPSNNTTPGS